MPLLRAIAATGRNEWTNNNCEAINHMIKEYTQWRPQQLPDLRMKLRDLVLNQHMEADGRGNFQLQSAFSRHRVIVSEWMCMSKVQQKKKSDVCFRWLTVASATSADGTLTAPLTPGAGRKPLK
jgi:hypothetical protein